MDQIAKLESMLKKVDHLAQQQANAIAEWKIRMERLQEFGAGSVEEANQLLAKMDEELATKDAKIRAAIADIERKIEEVSNEYNRP